MNDRAIANAKKTADAVLDKTEKVFNMMTCAHEHSWFPSLPTGMTSGFSKAYESLLELRQAARDCVHRQATTFVCSDNLTEQIKIAKREHQVVEARMNNRGQMG